jgi:DNA replication protein DnaC
MTTMTVSSNKPSALDVLLTLLRALKLPAFARCAEEIAGKAEREGWTFGRYLQHLAELEVDERRLRRIDRSLRASDLPREKTLLTLDRGVLSQKVTKQLASLCDGGFVERGENLLVFGLPGRGKTHIVAAIGHELIQRGYRVLFIPTYALVQKLLAAKRDLRLERELASLDTYHAIILDDIGYVQQSRDEMEVLFTFLAERYERKSVLITSNLVFSDWIRIFKDPMTTAAAIDRLIHHAVIIEMTGTSFRNEAAKKRGVTTPTTTTTITQEPTTITQEPTTITQGINGAM